MFSDWDPIDNALFTHHITTINVTEPAAASAAAAAADKNLSSDGTSEPISDNIEDRFAYLLSSF